MRLLIVDDNAPLRRLLRRLVGDLAEVIHECDDGDLAVTMYAEHRPDWVVMDIEMNRLDGLSATAQIRATDPQAKIVMVTNYDEAGLRQAAWEAGAIAYVVKDDLLALRKIFSAEG